MSYKVEVAAPGDRWHELHQGRRYTLTAALDAFDGVAVLGLRGARILRREGTRWVQVMCYQPREHAA